MKKTLFYWISAVYVGIGAFCVATASQAPNPRSAVNSVSSARRVNNEVKRVAEKNVVSRSAVRRSANVISRNATSVNSVKDLTGGATGSALVRQARTVKTQARSGTTTARSAAQNVVKSSQGFGTVRGASRARATAVFDDVSKIGNGYSACRDAYTTCMDQLCAKANDTYRRCFCSSRFTDFRNTEEALDQAKTLLMSFEDNNLNAVDKSAAEVNAMYTATVGEAAIKNDTSGAQKTLSEISDLLSGKKKSDAKTNTSGSLGLISVDFNSSLDDIWGSDNSGIFGSGTSTDLSQLEGLELYNKANSQCVKIVESSCESKAVFDMVRSSYSILISQDCNAYEKKIETQRESVQQTARQAEKYLREARLEEYRSHNSADVNECIGKVKDNLLTEYACGANYRRCLDYTGVYVNATTGDPILTPQLFKLTDLIQFYGDSSDILGNNSDFNKFLDEKRQFATSALDTCRDLADVVWTEFKRTALIEIGQAQEELIENSKQDCLTAVKECYDTQSEQLINMHEATATASSALGASWGRLACKDKLSACAGLFGGGENCEFGADGKLTKGNNGDYCGMPQLLDYVERIDYLNIASGCNKAITEYLQNLCTPESEENAEDYPWNCRNIELGAENDSNTSTMWGKVIDQARKSCGTDTTGKSFSQFPDEIKQQLRLTMDSFTQQMQYQFAMQCEVRDGFWINAGSKLSGTYSSGDNNDITNLDVFYNNANIKNISKSQDSWGTCAENTVKLSCESYNTDDTKVATYNPNTDECTFTEDWYVERCKFMNGFYEDGTCYKLFD